MLWPRQEVSWMVIVSTLEAATTVGSTHVFGKVASSRHVASLGYRSFFFAVLLTVHISIILVINQQNAQILVL